jgi:hypothetical protein
MPLRWEKQPDGRGEFAYSGELIVAMIGTRAADPSRWWYTIDGVDLRRLARPRGEACRPDIVRRAVNKAWDKWCSAAGLKPT